MRRKQEMSTQQMDFMLSQAMMETKWLPLYGSADGPERTPSGFMNTVPCMRVLTRLPITRKLTVRDYLQAFWHASVDWTIDHLEFITISAFLLALAAVVV